MKILESTYTMPHDKNINANFLSVLVVSVCEHAFSQINVFSYL